MATPNPTPYSPQELRDEASIAHRSGDTSAAVALFEQILELFPGTPEATDAAFYLAGAGKRPPQNRRPRSRLHVGILLTPAQGCGGPEGSRVATLTNPRSCVMEVVVETRAESGPKSEINRRTYRMLPLSEIRLGFTTADTKPNPTRYFFSVVRAAPVRPPDR